MRVFFISCLALALPIACSRLNAEQQSIPKPKQKPEFSSVKNQQVSNAFTRYWHTGKAEITTYTLEQARYGALRKGTAVQIFVTEDFLRTKQVKADHSDTKNIPVLKLNTTHQFTTGIYPYHIMQSVFMPLTSSKHALKVSSSVQEWCGQLYTQLNNRKSYTVNLHSYFENESDQTFTLDKAILENELWPQIRIAPNKLPVGSIHIIPALAFTQIKHKQVKAYDAVARLQKKDTISVYTIAYRDLQRKLSIRFTNRFPHTIEGWTEEYLSGAQVLQSKATLLKRIRSDYWNKNGILHDVLRDSLGLGSIR